MRIHKMTIRKFIAIFIAFKTDDLYILLMDKIIVILWMLRKYHVQALDPGNIAGMHSKQDNFFILCDRFCIQPLACIIFQQCLMYWHKEFFRGKDSRDIFECNFLA